MASPDRRRCDPTASSHEDDLEALDHNILLTTLSRGLSGSLGRNLETSRAFLTVGFPQCDRFPYLPTGYSGRVAVTGRAIGLSRLFRTYCAITTEWLPSADSPTEVSQTRYNPVLVSDTGGVTNPYIVIYR